MDKNEAKRELSKLTGIDLFNPKYRDFFNRLFPATEDAVEEEPKEEVEEEVKEEVVEEPAEEVTEEKVEEVEDKVEDDKEVVEDVVENNEAVEEVAEDVEEVTEEPVEEVAPETNVNDELLDAKIELALIKSGVNPERLNSAKKLAKYEIHSVDEIEKINELLKEYPEWVRGYNPENIGMAVDETTNDLTEEEKRLKAMGINPRE